MTSKVFVLGIIFSVLFLISSSMVSAHQPISTEQTTRKLLRKLLTRSRHKLIIARIHISFPRICFSDLYMSLNIYYFEIIVTINRWRFCYIHMNLYFIKKYRIFMSFISRVLISKVCIYLQRPQLFTTPLLHLHENYHLNTKPDHELDVPERRRNRNKILHGW